MNQGGVFTIFIRHDLWTKLASKRHIFNHGLKLGFRLK